MSTPEQDPMLAAVRQQEEPLATAVDLMKALALIAETMNNDAGAVVQRLAWLAIAQVKDADEVRVRLFDLTHPTKGRRRGRARRLKGRIPRLYEGRPGTIVTSGRGVRSDDERQ